MERGRERSKGKVESGGSGLPHRKKRKFGANGGGIQRHGKQGGWASALYGVLAPALAKLCKIGL